MNTRMGGGRVRDARPTERQHQQAIMIKGLVRASALCAASCPQSCESIICIAEGNACAARTLNANKHAPH